MTFPGEATAPDGDIAVSRDRRVVVRTAAGRLRILNLADGTERPGGGAETWFSGTPPPSAPPLPEATVVEETGAHLRQYDQLHDPAQQAALRGSLLDEAGVLERACARDPERDSWEPLRAALVGWMNARANDWTPQERSVVVDFMFDPKTTPWFRNGFDVLRFATPVVEGFAHPPGDVSKSADAQSVEDAVVCPFRRQGGTLSRAVWCRPLLYGDELEIRPLGDLVSRMGSASFTEAAVLNVLDQRGTGVALDLVDALASDEVASLDAVRSFGDFDRWDRMGRPDGAVSPDPDAVLARLGQWSRERPARRDALVDVATRIAGARRAAPRSATRPVTHPVLFGD